MKRRKRWEIKVLKWLRDYGIIFGGFIVIICLFLVIVFMPSNNKKQKTEEEKLRIEEITYKGHQYIKFRGHDAFGTFCVLHDPDCVCQTKNDPI